MSKINSIRLGIDLGGTKTEIMALAAGGSVALRRRIATPRDYDSLLRAMAELVTGADAELGTRGSVGMAIPGSESFGSHLIKNANTTYLNGKPLGADLEKILQRPVRLANDANCFALSEASDGAAAGAGTVFGVIAGTGVGGGVVIGGKVLGGAHGIGGEWGHIPLPAPTVEEVTVAPPCYCGKRGCLETIVGDPGLLRAANASLAQPVVSTDELLSLAEAGDEQARAVFAHAGDVLGQAVANLVNIFDPQRIIIIENGVDVARFKVDPAPGLRDRLGLAADTLVVGGVGRLSPEKGFHHLVESIALVRRHGVSVDLVLAGDGPERSRLERDARTLGLEGHAHFLGMQRDPRPVYAALDMFALPSLEEGAPNALLEAMACGRAVVAARVGGVPEIVEHERSGLLVEPGSPAALAAALERLAVDPVLRRQLGHAAARRVREQFDISQMVAKHAALYRDLLLARHAN